MGSDSYVLPADLTSPPSGHIQLGVPTAHPPGGNLGVPKREGKVKLGSLGSNQNAQSRPCLPHCIECLGVGLGPISVHYGHVTLTLFVVAEDKAATGMAEDFADATETGIVFPVFSGIVTRSL